MPVSAANGYAGDAVAGDGGAAALAGPLLPDASPRLASTTWTWLQPRVAAILIALVLTGYPAVGAATSILGLESTTFSIPFRVAVGVVAVVSLFTALMRNQVKVDRLMLAFFLLYLLRLVYDWGYERSAGVDHALPFFLIAVVLPVLGLAGGEECYDEQRTAFWTMVVGVAGCILVSYAVLFTDLLSQQDYINAEGRVALEALNPISLGYSGVYTAAAAVIVLFRRPPAWLATSALGAIGLAAFIVISAGARGPIVAFVLAGLVLGADQQAGYARRPAPRHPGGSGDRRLRPSRSTHPAV